MGWGDSWEKVPKPFGQVMKEFNDGASELLKQPNPVQPFATESVTLEIPIKAGWQTRTINAIQVGDLAVCFDNDDEEIGLVTHVPTLTRFDNAIPDGEWTQDSLIKWCWKIQSNCPDSIASLWIALKEFNNTNYKQCPFLQDLKAYCLSVGVE